MMIPTAGMACHHVSLPRGRAIRPPDELRAIGGELGLYRPRQRLYEGPGLFQRRLASRAVALLATLTHGEENGGGTGDNRADIWQDQNATAMCKATKRQLNHYLSNASTKGVLDFISSDTGIPVSLLGQVQKGVKKGGSADSQGTWVHPRVAMHLAQWVSNEFAAMVTKWVLEIMSKGHVEIRPQPAPAAAPSADFARLESMVLQLTQTVAGIVEQLSNGDKLWASRLRHWALRGSASLRSFGLNRSDP